MAEDITTPPVNPQEGANPQGTDAPAPELHPAQPAYDTEAGELAVASAVDQGNVGEDAGRQPTGDSNDNPDTSQGRSSYDDPEVAHARFLVEHEDRRDAVDIDDLATRIRNYEPEETGEDYGSRSRRESNFSQALKGNPVYDRMEDPDASHPVGHRRTQKFSAAERPGFGRDDKVEYLEETAAKLHERANRKGDWAEILETHPVSKEYAEAHDINLDELTPEWLVQTEDQLVYEETRADEWDEKPKLLEEKIERYKKGEQGTSAVQLIDSFVESYGDLAITEDFRELAARDETTVGDLKKFYADLCKREAEGIRFIRASAYAVFEDIRNGKAASTTPSPEAAAA